MFWRALTTIAIGMRLVLRLITERLGKVRGYCSYHKSRALRHQSMRFGMQLLEDFRNNFNIGVEGLELSRSTIKRKIEV